MTTTTPPVLNDREVFHVQEQQAAGVAGGTSLGGAPFRVRDLNTIIKNNIAGASLATAQITLPAGKYTARGASGQRSINSTNATHKTRLHDVTNDVTLVQGINGFGDGDTAADSLSQSILDGDFELTATTVLEYQYYVTQGAGTSGLGVATNDGTVEVYGNLIIEKVG